MLFTHLLRVALEELGKALTQPIKVRWIDKPSIPLSLQGIGVITESGV